MTDATLVAVFQNAYDRPGMRLVAYQAIALPQFMLRMDVILQRRKPIPAMQEFVLRSVGVGVGAPDQVGAFLGLDARLAERAIVTEIGDGHLSYDASDGGRRLLALTPRGEEALRELVSIEPERAEIDVIFDRRLWQVTSANDRGLLRPRDVTFSVVRPLYSRTPRLDEISLEQIAAATAHAFGRRESSKDAEAEVQVLGVRNIVRAEGRYRPATLLVYRGSKAKDVDAIVAVDGHPSMEYTVAIADRGGLESLGVSDPIGARQASFRKAIAGVPAEVVSQAKAAEPEADSLRRALVEISRLLGSSTPQEPEGNLREDPRDELHGIQARLAGLPARMIEPWEHESLLRDALTQSHSRLLISSPVLSAMTVDPPLLARLEHACRREVQCTVIAHLDPEDRLGGSRALMQLRQLADRLSGRLVVRSTSSPVRSALVWDNYVVLSSFPWLGAEGDVDSPLRNELGLGMSERSEVQRIYDLLLSAAAVLA